MISRINNKNVDLSKKIYSIFQASYKIEAKLLNTKNFPPLKRKVNDFLDCNNLFYAYFIEEKIVGIIEVYSNTRNTHIQSLVVHPNYFRKGIASKLVEFILDNHATINFSVETGEKNIPAINLYKRFNFKKIKKWDTNHGIRKVRFIRSQ